MAINCWRCGCYVPYTPVGLNCARCEPFSTMAEDALISALRHYQFEQAEKRAKTQLPIITRKRHMPNWLLALLFLVGILTVGDLIYELCSKRNHDDDHRR